MWAWFSGNSIWVLIISGLLLVLLLLFGERVRNMITRVAPEKRREGLCGKVRIVFWTIEGIALAVVLLAFAAMVLFREGIYAAITLETVERWFLEHGTTILIIVAVGIFLWIALKRFLPLMLSRAMVKPRRGESREGMKKRADTLQGVFMGLGKILIILLVIFMVLSEINVNIGPILAGLGIVGIAVGFGAQYLIRDLIAGVFILLENQYRVGDVARVADIWGLVEEINLRKTVLRDLDGAVHHVPNGEIRVASNFTRHFSRVNLDVSVS